VQRIQVSNMSNNVSSFLVRFSDGSINVSASVAAFETALHGYVKSTEETNSGIDAAVNAVFDKHKGVRMPVPTLVSLALGELNCSASDWSERSKQVHAYVSNNKGLFEVKKGKSGGVARIADLTPAQAAE
jgi:hypothetical protein